MSKARSVRSTYSIYINPKNWMTPSLLQPLFTKYVTMLLVVFRFEAVEENN
jgi:hypothetical protein